MRLPFPLFGVVLVLLISCSKEKVELGCAKSTARKQARKCKDFEATDCDVFSFKHITIGHVLSKPCFNPSNLDEFVYVEEHDNLYQLILFNIHNEQKVILYSSSSYLGPPAWGRTGWISFEISGGNIWIIDREGEQLTQLTQTGKNEFPEFDYFGERIIYSYSPNITEAEIQSNPKLKDLFQMRIMNLDGIIIDSICNRRDGFCSPWKISSWGISGNILHLSASDETRGIRSFDYNGSNLSEDIAYEFTRKEIFDIQWHPSEMFLYYANLKGLYRYNTALDEVALIKKSCDMQEYGLFSISGDGSKILVQRIDQLYVGGCTISTSYHLVIMDSDGCNEKIVNIPQ